MAMIRAFSSLDLKLAFRMLLRYPGLTVLAGISIAFVITVGAVTFEGMMQILHPEIPLPEGDRIVALHYVNGEDMSRRRLLYDLRIWREELETVEELGAFRTASRNLTPSGGEPRLVNVAELDAAALALARTPARFGRLFTAEDEASGAPPVVVLSHDVWRDHFASNPDVVGTTVDFGAVPATVVGVMPEGFAYPNTGDVWTPLRGGTSVGPGEGPPVNVVGRLAPGASLDRAGEELSALTAGLAAELPERYRGLTAHVTPLAATALGNLFDAPTIVALLFAGSNLPAILGIALGTAAALGLGRLMAPLLFQTSPRDPVTLGAVAVSLTAVAVLASLPPALRARRVSPLEALRSD